MIVKDNKEYYPLDFGTMIRDDKTYYSRSAREKPYFYIDLRTNQQEQDNT